MYIDINLLHKFVTYFSVKSILLDIMLVMYVKKTQENLLNLQHTPEHILLPTKIIFQSSKN